jgi:hypothetical protein
MLRANPTPLTPLIRRSLLILACALGLAAQAQVPGTVDVALYPAPTANTLEVRVRPNGQEITGVVSALTVTIRWNAASGASLGAIDQNIDGNACPLFRVSLSADPAGVQTSNGFNYLTYNAFSTSTLISCPTQPGYSWPADVETVIARIPVVAGTGCGRFQIVNDAYTGPNNKDLYVELNGADVSGSPYGSVIEVPNSSGGGCTDDCEGVPDGPALPGTPCDDGDPCTINDVYTEACQCQGTFEPSLCPVDIGLVPSDSDPFVLELRMRPNGNTVDSLVSGLTFAIRWETASGLSFGTIDQTNGGTEFCAVLGIPLEAEAIVEDGIYSYLTINGFGSAFLKDCVTQPGYNWPADQETTIMRLPLSPGSGCANVQIVNDAFTNATNRDYFISINGLERTGTVFSPAVSPGTCAWYSQSSGAASDPIWSTSPVGTPGAANFNAGSDVVVQSGHTVNVDMNINVDDLTLENDATLTVESERLLSIHGDQVNLAGTVTGSTGEFELIGFSATTMTLTGTIQLWNLTVANAAGVEVLGNLDIGGTLLIAEGSFDATNATVRLRSVIGGITGRLGPVGFDADYIGEITMQRRIPGGVTNWRLLSSPVYGVTVADWDDDFLTAGFPGSNFPNFDQPVGSGILWPSVRWYDETDPGAEVNDGLLGVPGIDYALTPGRGFAVWCGDASGGTNPFVIDVTGEPVIAPEALVLPMSWTSTGNPNVDGWNLVGNPLPSPIAFTGVNRSTNVLNQYHVYNPVTGNNAVWNGFIGTNGANGILQSSQGFWLKTNGPDVLTTVNEASKVADNTGGLFGGPLPQGGALALVRLTIGSAINGFTDEAVVVFETGTPAYVEAESDVLQLVLGNPAAPQIATRSSDGLALSINVHGPYDQDLAIPVLVNVGLSGTYTVTASDMEGITGLSCLVLEDLVTGTLTPMANGASYSFSIDATTPAEEPRFLLRATATIPLLVTNVACAGDNSGQVALELEAGAVEVTWAQSDGTPIGAFADATGTVVIDDLPAGNYLLSVSGGEQCILLQTALTITEPFPLEGLLTAQQDATCPYSTDGVLAVDVLGGTPPYAYNWDDGSTEATFVGAPGTVDLLVTDGNGCTWSEAWNLGSGDAPLAGINAPSFGLVGVDITFSAIPALADQHSWDLGDGTLANGAVVTHSFALPGTYQVTLVVSDGGCSDTTEVAFLVDQTTGLGAAAQGPANGAWYDGDRFVVAMPGNCSGPLRAELFDATGQLTWQGALTCSTQRATLPRADIASGIWLLRVQHGDEPRTYRIPVLR